MSEAELRAALQRPSDREMRIEPDTDFDDAVAAEVRTIRGRVQVQATESRL